jgi:hypothetical protein
MAVSPDKLKEKSLEILNKLEEYFDKNNLLNKRDGSFEDRIKCDEIKNEYCLMNNIQMIRIPYIDFDKINIDYIKELLCLIKI